MNQRIVDPISIIVAILSFTITLFVYFWLSLSWTWSFVSAIISATMIWISYLALRLIYLAMKK